ncbi:hypothetical protein SHLI107390_19245 [Shewanella livingstonensis]
MDYFKPVALSYGAGKTDIGVSNGSISVSTTKEPIIISSRSYAPWIGQGSDCTYRDNLKNSRIAVQSRGIKKGNQMIAYRST